jgi:uncharacterized protein YceH (UPF0502 family)
MTEQESAGELLDPFEMRVLAVLAEKEMLTPDVYPLSLNALTTGCNQLSSRDPVMSISETTVQEALDRLQQRRLVAEVSQAGARVRKYEHCMRPKWSLEQDKLSVLTLLMLRGAQTAGEIRSRSGRLHDFQSVADVEACLQFLIDKYPPLVAKLARAPGTKEARYMQLFAGAESLERQEMMGAEPATGGGAGRIEQLEQEVARLRDAVADLGQQFAQFKEQFE